MRETEAGEVEIEELRGRTVSAKKNEQRGAYLGSEVGRVRDGTLRDLGPRREPGREHPGADDEDVDNGEGFHGRGSRARRSWSLTPFAGAPFIEGLSDFARHGGSGTLSPNTPRALPPALPTTDTLLGDTYGAYCWACVLLGLFGAALGLLRCWRLRTVAV